MNVPPGIAKANQTDIALNLTRERRHVCGCGRAIDYQPFGYITYCDQIYIMKFK
jgi:hypothetical protein